MDNSNCNAVIIHGFPSCSFTAFRSIIVTNSNMPFINRPIFCFLKIQSKDLNPSSKPPVKVDVIAHRGASGNLPDHTLPSYRAAFLEGADWIELDVQCTSDGHLIINHDLDLSRSTDVSDWTWASAHRRRTKATPCLDGENEVIEGWMTSDFTLEEIKRLRVKQRVETRSQDHNLLYEVPIEENLVQTIEHSNFNGRIIIQSFEKESLSIINQLKPEWDTIKLLTKQELEDVLKESSNSEDELHKYMKELKESCGCSGIGPNKQSIIPDPTMIPTSSSPSSSSSSSSFSSPIIQAAHDVGLVVHPYTFRSDVAHLHRIYGGNASQEFAQFFRLGVDGVFADFPDHGVFARELYNRLEIKGCGFLLYSDMFD